MSNEFLVRQKDALKTASMVNPLVFWVKIAFFGLFLFGICLSYLWLESGEITTFVINQAAADSGTILITLSMFMTVLSYFFDRFDKQVIYRKHLGIIGFAYIVAHITIVVLMIPARYKLGDWLTTRILPFSFGAVATAIFAVMTLISNRYAATSMGGIVWRGFLRYGGYLALASSLAHIWLATSRFWRFDEPWALSFVVFGFGVITITLRILMKVIMLTRR